MTEVTMTQDARPSGASTKQRVFGDQKQARGDPFLASFFETAVEHVWGGLWNRLSLVLKSQPGGIGARRHRTERGAQDALARRAEPRWTVDELREALLQIRGYAGFPAAHQLRALSEIVTQR
jgi:hypothetical protein